MKKERSAKTVHKITSVHKMYSVYRIDRNIYVMKDL